MVRLFSLLCFILFGVYDSIQSEKSGGSRCLKPFLMPALIVFYLSSASSVQWLLAAALAFDWAGDVFLMSRRHRALLAGVISFGIGQFGMRIDPAGPSMTKLSDFTSVRIGLPPHPPLRGPSVLSCGPANGSLVRICREIFSKLYVRVQLSALFHQG